MSVQHQFFFYFFIPQPSPSRFFSTRELRLESVLVAHLRRFEEQEGGGREAGRHRGSGAASLGAQGGAATSSASSLAHSRGSARGGVGRKTACPSGGDGAAAGDEGEGSLAGTKGEGSPASGMEEQQVQKMGGAGGPLPRVSERWRWSDRCRRWAGRGGRPPARLCVVANDGTRAGRGDDAREGRRGRERSRGEEETE